MPASLPSGAGTARRNKVLALVRAWLLLDFFGDARRSGSNATSTLTTTIFTQSFLALVFASLLYPDTPVVPFAAANLSLSSLLVAIGTLGQEQRPQRRRADALLVGTAPIRPTTVALARSGHAAFYVALVTIGMALPPAILLAHLQHDPLAAARYLVLACACSGLACGALAVLGAAATRLLGDMRAALVMGTLKALLLGGGLVLFALGLRSLQGTVASLPIGRTGAELLPSYQAARVLADPAQAWRLAPLLVAAIVLLMLAAMLGDPGAATARARQRRSLLTALLRRLAGRGPRLAIAEFVATSMWRSPGFRGRVLPLLGLPAGMALLSTQGEHAGDGFVFTCLLLQLPAIYLPFLIAFLPRADQPEASWVFTHAPGLTLEVVRDATWRALVTHVLVPVFGLAAALLAWWRPDHLQTGAAVLFAFALAVLTAGSLVRRIDNVPFTRAADAEGGPELGDLFGSALVLGGLGAAFGALVAPAWRLPIAAAFLLLAIHRLRTQPDPGGTRLPEAEAEAVAGDPVRGVAGVTEPPAPPPPLPPANPSPGAPTRAASLRGELRAILVLYLALSGLPLVVGTMFAS